MPSITLSPLPSRAACGRADLVRALADGEGTLAAVAGLLRYERIGDNRDQPEDMETAITRWVSPRIKPATPAEKPFWRLEAVAYLDEENLAPPLDDGGSTELPTWPQGPKTQPKSRELASWRELVPRLRRVMTEFCDTRTLNVPAIITRLSRGDSLERLPHQTRRRWGQSAIIIEDRSDRLIPYWDDQRRVQAQLARLFPRYACEHRLYWEGLPAPIPAEGDAAAVDWLPPPGCLVIVLGDLGVLAQSGGSIRQFWADFGRRLVEAGCRSVALTPVAPDRYPVELRRYWQRRVGWERTPDLTDDARRAAAVERLLALLSPASRIEPGLLREVRLAMGGDAAIESAFWQHPALVSHSSVAATLHAQAAQRGRQAFANEEKEVQRKIMRMIRRWRGGLRPEVWYAEIQGLERELRKRLIDSEDASRSDAFFAEDANQSVAFFAALGRRLKNPDGPPPPAGLAAWFRFVEQRLPKDYQADPELGEHFTRLWRLAHAHESQSTASADYDPARFSTLGREVRRVIVRQQGDDVLWFVPEADFNFSENPSGSSLIARLETRNGEIKVEAFSRNAFWKSGQPPTWADDWGTDKFGHWVTFRVSKVTQRLRWIEPGTFLMGSPADEPERSDREGPQHSVTINRGFWLFDTACTQALWQAVMGDNPSRFKGANHPVENVRWDDCQHFLQRFNQRLPGLDLTLPSEAQWEYACRAGTMTPFSLGPNITPEQVNYDGNYPYQGGKKGLYRQETVPVATLPPNRWGLYEMHGNVWEWTQDRWHDNYRGAPTDGSAWEGGATGGERVYRGGSWYAHARYVRAAVRFRDAPGLRTGLLGFRPARVQDVSQAGSQPAAEPAEPASGWQAERQPASVQPGGAVREEAVLLRLDTGEVPVRCALPQAPAFFIRTDRERLTINRLTRPHWARAIGRDRFGLWSEIAVEPSQGEPVIQRLRWIPPGRFWMGSPESETRGLAKADYEREWFKREHPPHLVTLTQGYWLFDTPCTQALWEAVMGNNPSEFKSPTRPVEQVSWEDVQEFLGQINTKITGLALVLPTEAQWEYACRAGTETAIYTGEITMLGDNNAPALDPIAWYGGNSGVEFDLENGYDSSGWPEKQYPHNKAGTRPVGLKQPNPWGLYDMLGNVWEWCQDGLRDYDSAPAADPVGPLQAGGERVYRGGSWHDYARFVRAAYRHRYDPGYRFVNLGFRPARVQDVS